MVMTRAVHEKLTPGHGNLNPGFKIFVRVIRMTN